MRRKKDLPLVVLETLEPYLKNKDKKYRVVDPKGYLLKIIDDDVESDFYFEVRSTEYKNGKTFLEIEFKPQNKNSTNSYKTTIEHSALDTHFKSWTQRLSEYEKVVSIYDDPILKKNEERFLNQFEILDEDADFASFDLQQQIFLEDYLEGAKKKLLELKEGRNEEETKEIENLVKDTEEIKSNLTKESKKLIIKRLSRFWGKAQKTGLDIIKEIFTGE